MYAGSAFAPAPFKQAESAKLAAAPNPTLIAQDTCLDKKFSIVFYVILDYYNSLPNTTAASTATYINTMQIPLIVSLLNTNFSRICVSFETCSIVTIPSYTYNTWQAGSTDSVIVSNWYTPNTINLYLPTNLTGPGGHVKGYSSAFPTGTTTVRDFVVFDPTMFSVPNMVSVAYSDLMHAFGHYFGLPHTYAEITGLPPANGMASHELPDGSNGQINGDGFDDTDADCYPVQFNNTTAPIPPCWYEYSTGVQDANGNYYTPPVDNYMSAYNCRCRFTQRQYNAMAKNILTSRMYLH